MRVRRGGGRRRGLGVRKRGEGEKGMEEGLRGEGGVSNKPCFKWR